MYYVQIYTEYLKVRAISLFLALTRDKNYSVSALKKVSYTFSVLKYLWLSMNIINDTAGGILSGSVSHYVLPDVQCVQHYLELWQHPAITDLILLQTTLTHVI